ncbi:hypothetical protein BJY52DRAFT_1232293 [Lactarius psammicola]|nr:hypothetical protein BJY52DRAFT_1232293 [Lactarius psammicola]
MYSHINISQTTWSSSIDDIDGGDNQAEETSVYSFGSTLSLQSSNGVGRDGNTVHRRRHMTSDHPYTSFSDPVDVSSSDAESFDEDDMYGSDHNTREVVMESSDEEWVEGSQCSDDRVTCSNAPHSVATSSSDMYSSDAEAINYCGSDDRIDTTSGSSDDKQGADTSHSVEDMIDGNLTEILQSIQRNADNMSLMAQELCRALGIDIDSLSDTLYDQDPSPP